MKRTICLSSLLAVGVQCTFSQERPNILFFMVDDMGLMDTSVPFMTDDNGQPVRYPLNEWYRTPNMERMAKQGIRFSTFYTQSVSSPSRASLMTGQNATRHGTTNWIEAERNNRNNYGPDKWNWRGITKDEVTLPRVLQQAGYKTIHVGKAHFGCNNSDGADPLNVGFDVNIAGSAIGHPGSYYGEDGYGSIKGEKARAVTGLEKYHGTQTFLTDALTIEAKDQMKQAVGEKRPFFLYLSHYAVHGPFMEDKRFIDHYKDSQKPKAAQRFAALVEGMDQSLGNVMDYLETLGIAENTLIVFMGDNGSDAPLGEATGCFSSAPIRGKKGTEYEGGMRVPFMMCWGKVNPNNKFQKQLPISQGAVQTQLGTVMDIFPTLASVGKAKNPKGHILDGVNLRTQLMGKKNSKHPETFLMHFPHQHNSSYFTSYRNGDWKLIYEYNPANPQSPKYQLYNLKDDFKEAHNLADVNKVKLMEMMKKMVKQLESENALYPQDAEGKELRPIMPKL